MAAAPQQAQGSADSVISLQSEAVLENNPSKSASSKEQILSGTENTNASNARGATSIKSPKGAHEKAGSVGKGGEQPFLYQHNVYAPQPQALYSGGYMNPSGQWEEYPHYVNMEGLHSVSPVSSWTNKLLCFFLINLF
jgi:hypothetical protein